MSDIFQWQYGHLIDLMWSVRVTEKSWTAGVTGILEVPTWNWGVEEGFCLEHIHFSVLIRHSSTDV